MTGVGHAAPDIRAQHDLPSEMVRSRGTFMKKPSFIILLFLASSGVGGRELTVFRKQKRVFRCRVREEQFSSFKYLDLEPGPDSGPGLLRRSLKLSPS